MGNLIGIFCGISFALALAGTPAFADRYEESTLFRKGTWSVSLTHDSMDGQMWCAADTTNRSGQTFSITAFDNNNITLFVFDSRWDLTPRPIRFLVDIDYTRWTMDGRGDGISVSLTMNDAEKAALFLKQLQKGSAVAVYNETERRLASFSLNGSSASISALFDCWGKIVMPKDPFGDASDPFGTGGTEDPF